MSMILEELWKVAYFRKATYALREQPIFEKFINNIVNDTLWCLDEGIEKLQELKKFEEKAPATDEEKKTFNQTQGTARYFRASR